MSDIPPPTPSSGSNPNPTTLTPSSSSNPNPTTLTPSSSSNPNPNPFESNPTMRVIICRQCSTSITVYEGGELLKCGMGFYSVRAHDRTFSVAKHPYIILDDANVRLGELVQNTCREVFCRHCDDTILGWHLVETGMYLIDPKVTLVAFWKRNQVRTIEFRVQNVTPNPNQNRPTAASSSSSSSQ
ncbi:hypothetical protein ACJIZ3_002415 [Penstemon smallii]|uniref:Yippee domain-containing protein n=1 Tax=Penstemon smallii TaxID=265156 RepID=A0ABD3U6E1_9LAMI